MITDLNELADEVHKNAREKGFHDMTQPIEVFVANQCNNLHAEVTELWDAWRAGTENSLCDKGEKMIALGLSGLTCTEEELADIVIRALDVSRRIDIDIVHAVNMKHRYNKTRSHKHGKKN